MENEDDNADDDEVDRALEELEEENFDSEDSPSPSDDDLDISSIDNPVVSKNYRRNNKTRRQKGDTKGLIQLPDRRPRKDKKVDFATEMMRREEKERKRKQYLKKQMEAHEKATLEKILNETGRKLRLREEKEIRGEMERDQKSYRSLGDVPKVVMVSDREGDRVMVHATTLFPPSMTEGRDQRMREACSQCGGNGKYRLRQKQKYACSLPCYKLLSAH